jgi:hypothetical protein
MAANIGRQIAHAPISPQPAGNRHASSVSRLPCICSSHVFDNLCIQIMKSGNSLVIPKVCYGLTPTSQMPTLAVP